MQVSKFGTQCPSAQKQLCCYPLHNNVNVLVPSNRQIRNLISNPEILQIRPRWCLTKAATTGAPMRVSGECEVVREHAPVGGLYAPVGVLLEHEMGGMKGISRIQF